MIKQKNKNNNNNNNDNPTAEIMFHHPTRSLHTFTPPPHHTTPRHATPLPPHAARVQHNPMRVRAVGN